MLRDMEGFRGVVEGATCRMPWYNNRYRCPECGTYWEDAWSAQCDDECPNCECASISPVSSEDLSVVVRPEVDGEWSLWRSHSEAYDEPSYRLIGLLKPTEGEKWRFTRARKVDEDRLQ